MAITLGFIIIWGKMLLMLYIYLFFLINWLIVLYVIYFCCLTQNVVHKWVIPENIHTTPTLHRKLKVNPLPPLYVLIHLLLWETIFFFPLRTAEISSVGGVRIFSGMTQLEPSLNITLSPMFRPSMKKYLQGLKKWIYKSTQRLQIS